MLIRLLAAALAAAISFAAHGQGRMPAAGKDFLVLQAPQPTETPGKIEVLEFFWYRCPHCYALEPSLEAWVKKLPADAQFRRVPAVFDAEWALDARVYYALEALGEVDRVQMKLFDAIHKEGGVKQRGNDYLKWITAWLSKQGMGAAKFEAALKSFSVDSKTKRANQITGAYRLEGVPAIVVDGRYLALAQPNPRDTLAVADFLIAQVRATRKPAAEAKGPAKKATPAK
ncbi:MAG: thiol:disulfide interchange protein DsbA/DsbL [Burkholderiales bacterium]|nr:thiol:disulfide interchange protein DsbA/DsbL [Burkholderiales bacterium]